jgi:outer membrane usher protein
MQVIVTDLLGREQIMSETFFVNPILLRKGLDMHSVEAGWLRNRYGLTSNDYGDAFASATYRVGVTDALTSEVHAETLTVLRPLSGPADTMVQFTLLRLFGNDRTGGITVDHQEDQNGFYTQYQHATPLLGGTGYRAAMMNASLVARQELQVARNESFGSFQLEMARIGGETSTRQMMQGGIATIGDGVFLTRNLGQGFAIVDTNGIANVPVMLENQIVAYTDQRGHALVSNIQPYQPNLIAIDPLALPLDASVGNTKQTVMPRRCGCALVEFEVRSMRSATLIIQLPDGTPLPPWTVVTVTETADEYVIGSRGEVFVDLPYAANNLITATLADGRQCSLRVDHPPADQVSPCPGPLQCSFSVR